MNDGWERKAKQFIQKGDWKIAYTPSGKRDNFTVHHLEGVKWVHKATFRTSEEAKKFVCDYELN